jgi:hypothetical protein
MAHFLCKIVAPIFVIHINTCNFQMRNLVALHKHRVPHSKVQVHYVCSWHFEPLRLPLHM